MICEGKKKTKTYYEEGFVAIEGFLPSFHFFFVYPFSLLLSFLVSLSFSSCVLCVSQVSKNTNNKNKKVATIAIASQAPSSVGCASLVIGKGRRANGAIHTFHLYLFVVTR
jgi:hypothetical protein